MSRTYSRSTIQPQAGGHPALARTLVSAIAWCACTFASPIFGQSSASPADSAVAATPSSMFLGVPFVVGAPVVTQPSIKFPLIAELSKRGGKVVVAVLVGVDGAPERHRIISSDPPLVFDRAVGEAIPEFRFAPATARDGKPVRYETHITFDFSPLREPRRPFPEPPARGP